MIDASRTVVARGETLRLAARAMRSTEDGKTLPVPAASFVWSSSDTTIARVSELSGNRRTWTGRR